jgi:quinohemoprotein ethanol dehydrogenase
MPMMRKTGELLWQYDPQVDKSWAVHACCDVVNRGVAVWNGKVFVGTLDGRMVAIDAGTGQKVWETLTIDKVWPYTITGAPRVVKGKVIIGNGGAEYGVRGYITAYDTETGQQAWRFYTVPGNPADGFENELMKKIAETWSGEWWTGGGGGTVWDSMAYDPDLDLLYIGVGNAGHGTVTCVTLKAKTICLLHRLWPSGRIPVNTSGIIRKRQTTVGITPLPST